MEAIAGAAIIVIQLGTVLISHLKGKKGAKVANEGLDKKLLNLGNDLRTAISLRADSLDSGLAELKSDVQDLKAYVIGPDGQNGLRGDVRELKTQVTGLLAREPSQRRRR